MAKAKKTFEESLQELDDIVEGLEKGELGLDESMALFQKGMELSKFCNAKIEEAEKKISILIENEKGDLIEDEFIVEEAK